MSEFHYVRTLGVEGGVDAVEGRAIGMDLDSVLAKGAPPFKIALEVIAALCEILDIADQDGEVHGEVSLRYVFLDETGAVSLEGFGVDRTKTPAPERAIKGTATDLYGLGLCAFKLFAGKDLPIASLPDGAEAHDDAIIDEIVKVNFDGMPEELVGDIQWFLAKLLAHDREERPTPVEVWRTFIAFAETVSGPRLDGWSNAALSGGGDRRDTSAPASPPPAPAQPSRRATEPDEDLGGPVVAKGPLTKGAINFESGGGRSKQATAFWSKEAMKAALEAEDDEEEYKPKVGGGSATSFWTKEQMDAMAAGNADAPRPKRKASGRSATTFIPLQAVRDAADMEPTEHARKPADPPRAPKPPPPVATAASSTGRAQPVAESTYNPYGNAVPGSVASSGGPSTSNGWQPQAVPPPAVDEAPASGGGGMTKIVVGVVVLAVLACGGFALVGGGGTLGWYALSGSPTAVEAPDVDEPDEPDQPHVDPTDGDDGGKSAEEPENTASASSSTGSAGSSTKAAETKPKTETKTPTDTKPSTSSTRSGTGTGTTSSKSSSSSTSSASTSTSSSTSSSSGSVRPSNTKTTVESTPAASAAGPAKISFKSSGRGSLRCSDGQSPSFDGGTSLEFDSSSLPVTCMVTIEGKKGVFQVERTSTVTCDLSGSEVACR